LFLDSCGILKICYILHIIEAWFDNIWYKICILFLNSHCHLDLERFSSINCYCFQSQLVGCNLYFIPINIYSICNRSIKCIHKLVSNFWMDVSFII
jgi:hypothetical protein